MQISYLADYPHFASSLALLLVEHWRSITPEQTLESRTARLLAHCNRDVLPIAWVAHEGEQPLGTAALRVHDLPGREDLTPWLGGVFVAPEYRKRGIGAALCVRVEEEARKRGYRELYLFTLDKQDWYASFGWDAPQPATWREHPGVIMHKSLL